MPWRLIKHGFLAIVLGMATTLLVAWACALWINIANVNGWTVYANVGASAMSDPSPVPAAARIVVFGTFGPSQVLERSTIRPAHVWIERSELNSSMTYVSDARGWPLLSMRGGFDIDSPDGRGRIVETHWAIILDIRPQIPGRRKTTTPILPLQPIWSGFAINTLIYTLFWWVLLITPRAVRRKIRKSRGLCLECGYDLRGMDHTVCPECGSTHERARS